MAELDYAFLADYAVVEGGKLTAVGASFTRIITNEFPMLLSLHVAGRVRADLDEEICPLRIKVSAPNEAYEIEGIVELIPDKSAAYAEGKIGVVFAVNLPIQLVSEGLYSVTVSVTNTKQRVLKFHAGLSSEF